MAFADRSLRLHDLFSQISRTTLRMGFHIHFRCQCGAVVSGVSMRLELLPALGLGLVVATYWSYVGFMILRNSRQSGGAKNLLVPSQRKERWMMGLWAPLVWGWISLPFASVIHARGKYPMLDLPEFTLDNPAITAVRFVALLAALTCLVLSIVCWRYMGSSWRMAVDPTRESTLMQDGPFAFVRHPIYSLSLLLMVASVI